MKRRRKLVLNTGTAILNQVMTLIFGLIVPKLIISHYGSSINGLVSSITQFLGFFSLLEMGVGGVIRAALYKPLAENDEKKISGILIAGRRFFETIGMLMVVYTIVLMIIFPSFVDNQIGYISTAILVAAISISYISQYMFGIVNQLLLTADQKAYIQMAISCITIALNTVVSVVLIQFNVPIHYMKLGSAFVLLLRPVLLKIYVSKHYKINYRLKLTEEPLKQKWNALNQSVAYYIAKHADTVILTFFSSLENVSIYFVYSLVTHSLQQLVELLATGMSALLGDMYARREKKLLQTFALFEFVMHFIVTGVFTVAGITILPFVRVYTKGVTDANYIVPVFSGLIVFASATYALRLPYNMMVQSAGHFKQTQLSSIIEAILNVVVSIALVWRYGLVGVAIGTVIAMGYRTFYLAWYLSKNILYRPLHHFVKHLFVDIVIVVCTTASTFMINMGGITYASWIMMALKVALIAFIICAVLNYLFYRKEIMSGINYFKTKWKYS